MTQANNKPPVPTRDLSTIPTQKLPEQIQKHANNIFHKKSRIFYYIAIPSFGCLFLLCALVVCVVTSSIYPVDLTRLLHIKPRSVNIPTSGYVVISKPSIEAAFIDRVLAYYGSPAQNKGQVLYAYGVKYSIDPAYALAFFMRESSFGRQGVATVTHSLGNIRARGNHPSYQGYRSYQSWEEGFADWYDLIANTYVDRWGLYTVDQIIPVYAPGSDHNDEAAYIRGVKVAVSKWRMGIVVV
ncbi:MAG: hypothetical protein E6J34_09970 [Chloroflexi bacterium]|nr:MAG: hypothetical protein E6J34_09970 [Chloroflexota bacterium]